jgi:DNA-directed RNA polymerase specialized sigma24 family protein
MRKHLYNWFSKDDPCSRYTTIEERFEGLKQLDNAAILCLQLKALPKIKNMVGHLGLEEDKATEILSQSTIIFLEKIQTGAYQFRGYEPSTYLIEVARRMAMSAVKALHRSDELSENHHLIPDPDIDNRTAQQENDEQIRILLDHIGDPCAQIIRLRYLDGYSDEDVIRLGLTKHSSVNSLKVKRSDCMKKLVTMAKKITPKEQSE